MYTSHSVGFIFFQKKKKLDLDRSPLVSLTQTHYRVNNGAGKGLLELCNLYVRFLCRLRLV